MARRAFGTALARLGLVCAVAAILASAGRARADEETASAAQEHRRGVQAFAEGRYREAIESFRRADALRPSPAISFNVARAYERLGDPSSAILEYREYLRRAPRARDAQKVQRRVRLLEQQLEQQRLDQPQQRELEQRRNDDQRLAEWLEQRGQAAESPAPAKTQAVRVVSTPPGASVSIDGVALGTTPFSAKLPPGPHTLLLQLSGFSDSVQRFDLSPDTQKELAVELRAPQPVAQGAQTPKPSAVIPAAASLPVGPRTATEPEPAPAQRTAGEPSDGGIGTAGVLGWIAAGSGAAALGGALTFELLRRDEEERARRAVTQIGFSERLETMHSQQTAARVLAGVGGGLAVLGSVLIIADAASEDETHERSQLSAQLMLGPRGAGARLWARY
jgi:tetratricopeptide (TPR) repeat protein